MNYLAHFYLSGDDKNLILGNYLGDFVRGKEVHALPPGVKKGILLHRYIDTFTDDHSLVRESKKMLYPEFGKYAAVILDVYFDYFLTGVWEEYEALPLRDLSDKMYQTIGEFYDSLPERAKRFYNYMLKYDILFNYANKEGLQKVFNGLAFRATNDSKMEQAVGALSNHEAELLPLFKRFFPELKESTIRYREAL